METAMIQADDPAQTPVQMPGQMPGQTPGQTPGQMPGQTPPRLPDAELHAVLRVDAPEAGVPPRFACRPVRASSLERHTVYGKFAGQIGLYEKDDFDRALHELATDQVMKIILDLSEAQLSRTAVGVLVGFAAAMFGTNRRLYLYKMSPHVKKMLSELSLLGFFTRLESAREVISVCEA